MFQSTKLTLLFFSLLGQLSAQAQSLTESAAVGNGSQISTSLEELETTKIQKPVAVSISLGKSQSLFRTGSGREMSSLDLGVSGSYHLNPNLAFNLLVERSYDEKSQQADWGRVKLTTQFKKFENGSVATIPRLSLGIPASRADLDSSVRARVSAGADIELKTALKNLEIVYSPTIGYSHFDYETTAYSGQPNTPYSLVQSLAAVVHLNDQFAASANVTYIATQNFQKTTKEFWSHSEELSWKVANHWALALGHVFGVPYTPLRKESQDFNIALLDQDSSVVYTQLTADF